MRDQFSSTLKKKTSLRAKSKDPYFLLSESNQPISRSVKFAFPRYFMLYLAQPP